MTNTIEINQLRYFLRAASLLHIKDTARNMGVSQPAVTRAIQLIETRIGISLFRRSSNGLILTPRGREFLKSAQVLTREYAECIQRCRAVQRAASGSVVVGLDVGVFLDRPVIFNLVRTFRQLHPNFDVHVEDVQWANAIESLSSYAVDLLITMNTCPTVFCDQFETGTLPWARTTTIVNSNHELARAKGVSIAQLDRVPLLILDESSQPGFEETLLESFNKAGAQMFVVQRATSEMSLLAYTRAGMGVAVLNTSIESPPCSEVTVVEITDLSPSSAPMIQLLSRRGERYPALDELLNHLESAVNPNKAPRPTENLAL